MTFLLPHTEALGFSSDDLSSTNSLHDAFFDESKQFKYGLNIILYGLNIVLYQLKY